MDYTIKSVVKALEVLELLSNEPLTAKEISEKLGINKSTLHRFLYTLESQYYIEQNSLDEYRLSQKMIQMGMSAQNNINLSQIVRPYLLDLSKQFGESAILAGFDQHGVYYMDKAESPHAVRIVIEPGKRAPGHCVASGKMFLSYLSTEELKQYVDRHPLIGYTENTITEFSSLKQELEEIKKLGYAVDHEEYEVGLKGIASPIYNYSGKMVAALCVAGVSMRIPDNEVTSISKALKEMAKTISIQLGVKADFDQLKLNIKN
jgi:IclR family KDG regulon transcriptional repressor